MQSGTFFRSGDMIAHIDRDGVSPVGFDGRSRELSVDEESTFVYTVWSNETPGDVEVVSRPGSWKRVQQGLGLQW